MDFASRITRAPRAYEPDRATDIRAALPEFSPEIMALLEGTSGCSPYLRGLIEKEATWLETALTQSPENVMAVILSEAGQGAGDTLGTRLRQAKRRTALITALADLGGVWTLEDVTKALTDFADLSVDLALKHFVGQQIDRGKMPGLTAETAPPAGGCVALAMGKMGAHELNYSSDIDLIVLFDETIFEPSDYMEARTGFIKATRSLAGLLSDLTGEGYVFRTDLRLRPDPAVTPVCLSMDAAERYYESLGRTWERAAYIKARAAAGDTDAGDRFLDHLKPFVWRRHLDFAAIQDAHDMRLRIRDHKGLGGALSLPGHNMKLGSGGIREIEFFTQTRQMIAGGRDAELRVRGTVEGLRLLIDKGWADGAEPLIEDYRAHREVEHRLQMIADQQTQSLPKSDDGFARLAAFMDRDIEALKSEIETRLTRVAEITEGFFAPAEAGDAPDLSPAQSDIVARWTTYPALRSPRAVEIFSRVQPELLSRLNRAANPDEALVHIDGFLAGLPAGVQLLSLFEANPQLIDLIVDIAATAPNLAQHLSRNSSVLDAVIGGSFFEDWPGANRLTDLLSAELARLDDYETQLDAARRWMKEWHFRVGVHHLRDVISSAEAGQHYADLAHAVLAALWDPVVAQFSAKHGPPPGAGAAVLGMGSLGAARLTSTSDLDLIVIYDGGGVEASDGRRPLPTRSYYARLTQAFVTAMTAPMAEGRLYEIDMRLRPSGKTGPVATSLAAFETYQATEAWTWEHLALTHARPVAGSADLAKRVEAVRTDLLARPREKGSVFADVTDMRMRLCEAKPQDGPWDVKNGPGGAQDIALFAETGALLAGSSLRSGAGQLAIAAAGFGLSSEHQETITSAQSLFFTVQTVGRLVAGDAFDPRDTGEGVQAFLLRETKAKDIATLQDRLASLRSNSAKIIDTILAG